MGLMFPRPYPIGAGTYKFMYLQSMNRLSITLALMTLGMTVSSCDDPIAVKERSLQERRIKEGVLTTSQTFDFTRWIEVSKGAYRLPSISVDEDAKNTYWASASNQGYTMLSSKPTDFPVIPLEEDGAYRGAIIRSIKGFYFFGMGTNVIAGALYSGQVDARTLVGKPLESTLFGQPYSSGIPEVMKFTYQYKAGEKVIHGQNKRVELPSQDRAAVSAVFYEVTEDDRYLNGITLQSDARIVAKGYVELEPTTPEGTWQTYSLRLSPVDQARYDAVDFSTKKYRLALVFSSSYRGAEYIGAIGSELRLQQVTLQDRIKPHQ